ncbi:hypothetical protein PAPYR_8821 [Paratrimastix pyriformis]|uniref:Uncharacterized protein n=1 Tax=Paratrimastix pyriformis TaxID=342808 RepID=A0ABQ8U9S3_9EUKA|nr:hypothetical protein PAPYR_8821 [Paratrimastix pyriformis]
MRCDLLIAQKDKSTAGTDMTCQILFDQFLDVSAVLRACCASVHSFLVWTRKASLPIALAQPAGFPSGFELRDGLLKARGTCLLGLGRVVLVTDHSDTVERSLCKSAPRPRSDNIFSAPHPLTVQAHYQVASRGRELPQAPTRLR